MLLQKKLCYPFFVTSLNLTQKKLNFNFCDKNCVVAKTLIFLLWVNVHSQYYFFITTELTVIAVRIVSYRNKLGWIWSFDCGGTKLYCGNQCSRNRFWVLKFPLSLAFSLSPSSPCCVSLSLSLSLRNPYYFFPNNLKKKELHHLPIWDLFEQSFVIEIKAWTSCSY